MKEGQIGIGTRGPFVRLTLVVDEASQKIIAFDLSPEEARTMGARMVQLAQSIVETSYTVDSVH